MWMIRLEFYNDIYIYRHKMEPVHVFHINVLFGKDHWYCLIVSAPALFDRGFRFIGTWLDFGTRDGDCWVILLKYFSSLAFAADTSCSLVHTIESAFFHSCKTTLFLTMFFKMLSSIEVIICQIDRFMALYLNAEYNNYFDLSFSLKICTWRLVSGYNFERKRSFI